MDICSNADNFPRPDQTFVSDGNQTTYCNKGWNCWSGYQSCIIREPGGEVKRSYSCHDEPLGTLDEGFELFKAPMPCITPTCVSSADSKIPKEKNV